ncbi:hypothetical protein [Lichenifustis flavocetrariae]|uniref:Uncharacterized protein n=1 Tax=Lichenifustis flavocetrariae TaxID=2949735 RepID=A0AA41ZC47_9HYPH|nr:hypothetical protein [Lichenifustis flavocetrariae]MCW6513167.1 hypothetical protein [Lichenifustis flavocetrariae]
MPERPRRFHQAFQEPGDDAALSGQTEIVELQNGGDAEFEQRDGQFAGCCFAEGCIGPVAADQHIVEALA